MNKKQRVLLWLLAILVFLIGLAWVNSYFSKLSELIGKLLIVLIPGGLIFYSLSDSDHSSR